MFDSEMRYLAASRRFIEDYGLDLDDLTGLSHYEVFPEIPDRLREIHQRSLAGEILHAEEEPFPRSSGKMDWVHWESRPWLQSDGSVGGLILFSEVITGCVSVWGKGVGK
jgi:PAS domain S-box-containing protein